MYASNKHYLFKYKSTVFTSVFVALEVCNAFYEQIKTSITCHGYFLGQYTHFFVLIPDLPTVSTAWCRWHSLPTTSWLSPSCCAPALWGPTTSTKMSPPSERLPTLTGAYSYRETSWLTWWMKKCYKNMMVNSMWYVNKQVYRLVFWCYIIYLGRGLCYKICKNLCKSVIFCNLKSIYQHTIWYNMKFITNSWYMWCENKKNFILKLTGYTIFESLINFEEAKVYWHWTIRFD